MRHLHRPSILCVRNPETLCLSRTTTKRHREPITNQVRSMEYSLPTSHEYSLARTAPCCLGTSAQQSSRSRVLPEMILVPGCHRSAMELRPTTWQSTATNVRLRSISI